ncbi:hypothetical protein [Streptomyces sp. WAC 06738]|uniref:hypothetical protein n=1 Tax=Streptomyces sp. WAC 06738 TaxID=2203210 RepID=UPI0013DFC9E9|nr:hypothetical protein [Streptomyces sp. WAC 06738]
MENVLAKDIDKVRFREMIDEVIKNGVDVPRAKSDRRGGYYIDHNFGNVEAGALGQNGMRVMVDDAGNFVTAMPKFMQLGGMMLSFRFLPRSDDPSWGSEDMQERSVRTLTADDLTFHCFRADVVINDGENEICLRTPGLPVVDFVLMLGQLYREVESSGESVVETSQTQDSISAVRQGGGVEIRYSFSGAVSRVSLDEFRKVPASVLNSASAVLQEAHSDLKFNRYLAGLPKLMQSN